jgi:hypothetical protein
MDNLLRWSRHRVVRVTSSSGGPRVANRACRSITMPYGCGPELNSRMARGRCAVAPATPRRLGRGLIRSITVVAEMQLCRISDWLRRSEVDAPLYRKPDEELDAISIERCRTLRDGGPFQLLRSLNGTYGVHPFGGEFRRLGPTSNRGARRLQAKRTMLRQDATVEFDQVRAGEAEVDGPEVFTQRLAIDIMIEQVRAS